MIDPRHVGRAEMDRKQKRAELRARLQHALPRSHGVGRPLIHHALQVYAPHWTHMADEWPADAVASRRRMLESCAEHGALLFPIHFGAPHVARIDHGARGFSLRFVPGAA